MNAAFESSIVALNSLSDYLLSATKENRLLTEVYGVNHPALYPADLTDLVKNTKNKIISYGNIELTEDEIAEVEYIPLRVNCVLTNIAPHLFNGNGPQSIPSFVATFTFINSFLDDMFSLSRLEKENLLPKNITRRIKNIDVRIKEIEPNIESLEAKIK